jgi:transcription elongation factor/antiterminator RfaH
VRTLPRCEAKAQFHLGAQGLTTFLPQFLKTIRHARRLRTVRAALFPGYIFVTLDLTRDRWLSIRSTVGVSSLITCDGRPLPVRQGITEALIQQTDPSNVTRMDVDLVEGQPVRVLTGPFANLVGKLQKLSPSGRVRILLKLMGSDVPVSVERSALSRAA